MSQFYINMNASGLPTVDTLTGNSGGPVPPDGANNINILGSGAVNIVGNPATHTLTVSVAGMGLSWSLISASQMLAVNHGYICVSPGGALSLSLPAVSALGDMIEITLDGSTSFSITQGAGQQVRIGNIATTVGVGGSITSTQQGDSIRLICQTANLKWNVLSLIGNPIVV